MGEPAGRYAGFCRGRPSLYGMHCCSPLATYPRTGRAAPWSAVWSCSGRGLPSRRARTRRWWALAPPFHSWPARDRSRPGGPVLCCTFSRVAPGGRYPPPCSAEPGRSSARCPRAPRRGRLADRFALPGYRARRGTRQEAVGRAPIGLRDEAVAGFHAASRKPRSSKPAVTMPAHWLGSSCAGPETSSAPAATARASIASSSACRDAAARRPAVPRGRSPRCARGWPTSSGRG